MDIEPIPTQKGISISSISEGECFRYAITPTTEIYMKIALTHGYDSVNIRTGDLFKWPGTQLVIPVRGKFVETP